jgi:hypothetical protein
MTKTRIALAALLTLGVLAFAATPAFASGKPFVETNAATAITGTTATLNGVVNPNGAETKYYFEYGLASEKAKYEHKTTEVNAGSGETNIKATAAITGLVVKTSYRFRVVATNGNGTSEGAEATFTAVATPPKVLDEAVTGVKETEATLNAEVNPKGAETKYYFEYGTEKGKLTHKTAEASAGSGTIYVEVSKTITGLTESTRYYYRLVATNEGGTTDGAEESFTTLTKPTKPAVETEAATDVDGAKATLNGFVEPHGASTKYYFEYGLAGEKANYEYRTEEASAGGGEGNKESQLLLGLTASTSYRFRIVATNTYGTAYGSELTFTTTASGLPEFVLGEGELLPVTLEGSLPSAKSVLNTRALAAVTCEGLKAKGSITHAKAISLAIELTSCVESFSGEKPKCKTEGAAAGTVVLFGNGTGSPVYIDKAKTEIGVLLGVTETVITCNELKVKVKGTVVVPVTPVNTKTTKVDLAFKGNGKGKPTVESYENEKGESEKAHLELKVDGEDEEAALEVPEEIPLTANKSLTISG